MKLSNIKAESFKTLHSFELPDPQKVNVIIGKNGSGKTSVLEAIRFVLTGEAPPSPVTSGETQGSVSADFLGVSVQRNCGKKTTVRLNGKATTQKSVAEMMTSALGCTMDSLKIATSANMLSAMSAGALSDYLISNKLIPAEIDFDCLLTLCAMSPEAKAELAMMLPAAPVKFDMDAVDEAYDHFFAARTVLKSRIKEAELTAKFEGDIPKRSVNQIDAELQRFAAYASEEAAYMKLKTAYDNAVTQRNNVLQRIAKLEATIKETTAASPVDPKEKEFLIQQERKNQEEANEIFKTKQTLQVNINMFRRTLDNLNKPVCPISSKLVCTTDKTAIKEELTQLVKANEDEIVKADARIELLNKNNETIRAKIADYDKRERLYLHYKSLHDQRAALQGAIPTVPEAPKPPIERKDEASEKAALMNEREVALRYAAAKKAERDIEDLMKKLTVHEELITILSPKSGVRQEIIRAALDPIVAHCNSRAAELKMNFEVGMVADNGVKIVCRPNTKTIIEPLPLEAASSGEQAYTLFLIMDALNALHGVGLLMLDDLDKLDTEAFEALLALLAKPGVLDPYDHVFMALVDHRDHFDIVSKYESSIVDAVIVM